jgi:hypothetical protein
MIFAPYRLAMEIRVVRELTLNSRATDTPVHSRYPGFGPFDGEALQAEIHRAQAGLAMRCLTAQLLIVVAFCVTAAVLGTMAWQKISAYELALKHCAGV